MADLCSRQKRQIGGMQRADGWSKTRHRRTRLFRLSDRRSLAYVYRAEDIWDINSRVVGRVS